MGVCHFSARIAKRTISCPAIYIVVALTATRLGHSQIAAPSLPFYYDAQSQSFTRDLKQQVFEGEVVLIGAGTLISADRVSVNRSDQTVEARGHIILMSPSQVFTGETLRYQMDSGDFRMTEAHMVTNDTREAERASRRILGFTPKEAAFESARRQRLKEITDSKLEMRDTARRKYRKSGDLDEGLITQYELLLRQEGLVRDQENPSLAQLAQKRRDTLKARREFWQKSRSQAESLIKSRGSFDYYFRMNGSEITRTNGNDYMIRDALWTPCKCDEGESPAWGFRSDYAEAQLGGYADLYHPVLQIKGLPVLYLPYLKVPIKDKRQTGFLMPTFGFNPKSGNIYSQPVFFDLAPHSDATLTTDVFERRGTRLGLEMRYEHREYSGWLANFETIRDRIWMEERGLRDDLSDIYSRSLATAAESPYRNEPLGPIGEGESNRHYLASILSRPEYWVENEEEQLGPVAADGSRRLDPAFVAAKQEQIEDRLASPSNTWRGSYSWRGQTFLAPRLSVVSAGEVNSDHRYVEELDVPDNFKDSVFGSQKVKAYSLSRAQVHLDGRDFYAGAGFSYGDNFQMHDRFAGQQIPLRLKIQSRMLSLLPRRSPIPIYAQLMGESYRITEFSDLFDDKDSPTLGNGNWRRTRFNTVSPMLSGRAIQVSHFAEAEARYIDHAGLEGSNSEIRSWRTGIEFSLPIDGEGPLPGFMSGSEGTAFVQHEMDWRLRFSVRPSVVRVGPYADPHAGLPGRPFPERHAYFSSDVFTGQDNDQDVAHEDRMKNHQIVTLSTRHQWRTFDRVWQLLPGAGPRKKAEDPEESLREKARRELLYSLDQPITGDMEVVDRMTNEILVNRYRKTRTNEKVPVEIAAEISYDFIEAKKREDQRRENRESETTITDDADLARGWIGPNIESRIRFAGWSLRNTVDYDIYLRTARKVTFSLGLPTFLATNLSFGYTQEKQLTEDDDGLRVFTRTRTRSFGLVSHLIPQVSTFLSLKRSVKDNEPPTHDKSFESRVGFEYKAPSECWGLNFSRKKTIGETEAEADYLLELVVVFAGQQRELPNMSPGVMRRVPGDRETEEE